MHLKPKYVLMLISLEEVHIVSFCSEWSEMHLIRMRTTDIFYWNKWSSQEHCKEITLKHLNSHSHPNLDESVSLSRDKDMIAGNAIQTLLKEFKVNRDCSLWFRGQWCLVGGRWFEFSCFSGKSLKQLPQ